MYVEICPLGTKDSAPVCQRENPWQSGLLYSDMVADVFVVGIEVSCHEFGVRDGM